METIFQVKNLFFKSGYYYLQGYDFILNRMETIEIKNENNYPTIKDVFLESWPFFNASNNFVSIGDFLSINAKNKLFLRIKYKSINGETTTRTIKDFKVVDGKAYNDNNNLVDVKYLKGHCHLRNAERHFRLDRIHSVNVLNLTN